MTPQELKKQIDDLQKQIDELRNYSTIPLEVGNAFKARIIPDGYVFGKTVAGVPSTVTINESGSSTVTAQAPLSGKIGITINGTEYIVPTI